MCPSGSDPKGTQFPPEPPIHIALSDEGHLRNLTRFLPRGKRRRREAEPGTKREVRWGAIGGRRKKGDVVVVVRRSRTSLKGLAPAAPPKVQAFSALPFRPVQATARQLQGSARIRLLLRARDGDPLRAPEEEQSENPHGITSRARP